MATKMATVEKAEELLEKLRSASWNPAVQGMALLLTLVEFVIIYACNINCTKVSLSVPGL